MIIEAHDRLLFAGAGELGANFCLPLQIITICGGFFGPINIYTPICAMADWLHTIKFES